MEYIHIKKLGKYHPGYTDRELKWGKVYFTIIQGDPEFELIDNEIDKWRFIAMVCLELEAKKALPNIDTYWIKKFDIKKRPMSLTIQMLHNFIEVVTGEKQNTYIDKNKIREDKDKIKSVFFEEIYLKYPNRVGRKAALRHFAASVKTEQDWQDIQIALKNYLECDRVKKGFIQNASTWFNDWKSWVKVRVEKKEYTPADPSCKACKGVGKLQNGEGVISRCYCVKEKSAAG